MIEAKAREAIGPKIVMDRVIGFNVPMAIVYCAGRRCDGDDPGPDSEVK